MKTFSFRHAALSDHDLVTFYKACIQLGVRVLDVPDSLGDQFKGHPVADRNAHSHIALRKDHVHVDYVMMLLSFHMIDVTEEMKDPTLDKLLEALRPEGFLPIPLPLPEVNTVYLVDGNFEMPFESREEAEAFARFKRLTKDLNEDVRGLEGSAGRVIEWAIHNKPAFKAFAALREPRDYVGTYKMLKQVVIDMDEACDVGHIHAEAASFWLLANLARLDEISN